MASSLETISRPLYRQIVDIMMRGIAEGRWKSGQVLPSEQKLARQFGVSPGTVRKALDQLAADRLLTRRQGFGTLVAVSTREDMLYRFFKLIDRDGERFMPDCEQIRSEVVTANSRLRKLFNLRSGGKLARFLRRRHDGGRPIMVEWVSLPLALFKGIDRTKAPLPTTLYDFFETGYGRKVLRVEEKLSAVNADADDGELLGVEPGNALLAIERVAYSFDDQVIEHRSSRMSTADHAYLSELT